MRYGVLCCQTILFVLPPIAVKVPLIGEPIGAAWVPPSNRFPSAYLVSYRAKALVRIVQPGNGQPFCPGHVFWCRSRVPEFVRLSAGGERPERTRLGIEIPELAKNQIFRGFGMIPTS